jgi:hypothetical protein
LDHGELQQDSSIVSELFGNDRGILDSSWAGREPLDLSWNDRRALVPPLGGNVGDA